jgi:hypothetical protein
LDLSTEEQRRLEHLVGLFEREGATLQLRQEQDGAWRAFVRKGESEPTDAPQVRAWTPVEAAEVAWLRFHEALDLRGDGGGT